MRAEFPTAGDLVDILQGRKDDVADAGLHRSVGELFAERKFGIVLRFKLRSSDRRHRHRGMLPQDPLMTEPKRHGNNLCTQVRQPAGFR